MPESETFAGTRRTLHGIAELLLAGPQYRRSGTIRLRITPGGFGTIREPDLRVDIDTLVAAGTRIAIAGTFTQLGTAAGVDAGGPVGLYSDGCGVDVDEPALLDSASASHLAACFALGDTALRQFATGAEPVLWPEHFDLGISLDEVNYGVSPGDGAIGEPYAYVGPWQPRQGDFWNMPFGAGRSLREIAGDDLADVDAVVAFFRQGRDSSQ